MATEALDRVDGEGAGSPLRTCIVTRAELRPEELIRFAAGPDGAIVPDLACRLPGRGAWVTCDRAQVEAAVKTKAFARALKRNVHAAPDLADLVERLMIKRAMERLSIALKAGLVLTGFAKIDAAVLSGTPVALLHGSDAAEDGVGKLDRRYAAMCRDLDREAIVVRDFTIEQMSLALGRSNVVHAALMKGGAAQHFLSEAGRSRRYRAGNTTIETSPAARRPAPHGNDRA